MSSPSRKRQLQAPYAWLPLLGPKLNVRERLERRLDFSRQGSARVVLITAFGIALSLVVALLAVSYTTQFMTGTARTLTWVSAAVLPFLLSGPVFYYFASKLRQLAIAHHQLALVASQDSLTSCLNRGAFITLVEAYLSRVDAPRCHGALLMVDADHFKSINDRYGHAGGDEVLRQIVFEMKAKLRPDDLLGRVGGEEFAVFLPHVDRRSASAIAERIRKGIDGLSLELEGQRQKISVSVGGAVFNGPLTIERLFGVADACLYEAKHRGRNRVEFGLTAA